MKKTRKRITISFCIAFLIVSCIFIGISGFRKNISAENEIVYLNDYELKSEYALNETISFPSLSNVKMRVNDKLTKVVSRELKMPDGTISTLDEMTLTEAGNYVLSYYTEAGDDAVFYFTVNQKSYGESNCNAEYTTLKNSEEGIDVTLKNNGKFSFNKSVNLNDYVGGRLDVCTILPLFREDKNSKPDATHVSVKLVDAFDDSKYIEFVLWCDDSVAPYYISSGADSQSLTGLEQNVNRASEMIYPYEGDMYKIHYPTRYQVSAMYGRWLDSQQNSQMISHGGIEIQLDMSNAKVYAKDGTERLVTDLDSSEIYGEDTIDLLNYFVNGEVYLTVECYNFSLQSMNVQFSSILGYSGEELKNTEMIDTTSPVITLENDESDLILAVGKSVSIPKVKNITDVNYFGDYSVMVYRNYGKSTQYAVNVSNGTFTPTSEGVYTVVYTAKDSYGNIGTCVLNMSTIDEKPFNYKEEKIETLYTCRENILPKIEVTSLNKGLTTTVKVTDPNNNTSVLKEREDGYVYIPTCLGTYTIEYLFSDDTYSEIFSYQMEATNNEDMYMKEELGLPNYFVKNASYELPTEYAYSIVNNELVKHELDYYVSKDGGEFTKLNDASAYKITAESTIQFKLKYNDFEKTTPVYSVIDMGFGNKISEKNYINYIQGNYASTDFTTEGLSYTYTASGCGESILPISLSNFRYIGSFTGDAKSVKIILTDIYNGQNRVEISYARDGGYIVGKIQNYVDGELISQKSINVATNMTGSYEIDVSSGRISLGTNEDLALPSFTTDSVYFSYQVEEPIDSFTFTIKQLNNQQFTSSTRMKESGANAYYTTTDGSYDLGEQFTISPCQLNGVLNPVSSKDAKLSVINIETDEYVKDINGIELNNVVADKEYTILLSTFGQFRVVYTYSVCCSSKTGETTVEGDSNYVINVNDTIAPTIAFENDLNPNKAISITKGNTYTLASYTITDNATSSEKIVSYVAVCDDHFNILANGYKAEEYVFTKCGTYLVVVVAYDEYGNYARNYYNVIVK